MVKENIKYCEECSCLHDISDTDDKYYCSNCGITIKYSRNSTELEYKFYKSYFNIWEQLTFMTRFMKYNLSMTDENISDEFIRYKRKYILNKLKKEDN